jgi:hypothetical protein
MNTIVFARGNGSNPIPLLFTITLGFQLRPPCSPLLQ